MITILNRKELCITFSMTEQANIREALSKNNIDYYIKTINRMSPSLFQQVQEEKRFIWSKYGLKL